MSHDVIMPALGMTQDMGLIVAWHKQPGDAVKTDDVLFEVETDKSTMEVEAGHDGFVSALRAREGEEVPVGTVIAEISAGRPVSPTGPDAVNKPATLTASAPPGKLGTEPRPSASMASAIVPQSAVAASAHRSVPNGRVLASPKARRLARERGLDLATLAEMGIPQPYHVADLDRLATLPAASAGQAPASTSHVGATAAAGALSEMAGWLENETDGRVGRVHLLAALAAGAYRGADPSAPERVIVKIEAPGGRNSDAVYADPDRSGLGSLEPAVPASVPALIVRDLCATRITALRLSGEAAPVMTAAPGRTEGTLDITLEYNAGAFDTETAIALVERFVARIEMPVLNLL